MVRHPRYLKGLALLLTVTASMVLFVALPFFHITTVEVHGALRITPAKIAEVSEELLHPHSVAGRLLGNHVLFFPVGRLRTRLVATFPEIKTVALARVLPNHMVLTIEERTAVLLWQSQAHTYEVDAEGIAFREWVDPYLPLGIPLIGDASGEAVTVGTTLVSERNLVPLLTINTRLRDELALTPLRYQMPGRSGDEVRVRVAEGINLAFTLAGEKELAKTLIQLKALLSDARYHGTLSTIDLRIPSRAYVE